MRYLVKARGRTIDWMPVPKRLKLHRTGGGYKLKGGVVHRGYRLVHASSKTAAFRKVIG